jgi:hypothetical protein
MLNISSHELIEIQEKFPNLEGFLFLCEVMWKGIELTFEYNLTKETVDNKRN